MAPFNQEKSLYNFKLRDGSFEALVDIITVVPLPVNTGQHVGQQQQVSVPDQEVEKQNMG